MSSRTLPLHNDGIYRNLPTFPTSLPSKTAIITGANGIRCPSLSSSLPPSSPVTKPLTITPAHSGFHTLRVLLRSPQRWSKVYALSRRPPPPEMLALLPAEQRARVRHVALDLLDAPDALARRMQQAGVRSVDVVFFYAYMQPRPAEGKGNWNNADELVDVNCESSPSSSLPARRHARARAERHAQTCRDAPLAPVR